MYDDDDVVVAMDKYRPNGFVYLIRHDKGYEREMACLKDLTVTFPGRIGGLVWKSDGDAPHGRCLQR